MEVVKNVIEYVSIIMCAIILVYKTNDVLKYFQQSHYKFASFKRIIKHYYFGKWQYFIFGVIPFIWYLDKWYIQALFIIYIVFLLIIFFIKKDIIKLRRTPRIYRNYFCILVIGTIYSSTMLLVIGLPELISSLAIILFTLPFLILLSSLIVHPIEVLISKYYQVKARNKLNNINPIVIGITGSFGKTSTKNILFELLKNKYISLATRKSYNTLNGISIAINNDLTNTHELFICEMGASQTGDISDLLKIAKPKYAILTGITNQHLETFKTVQNIISEKIKIIETLAEDGVGFIYGDDKFIQSYKINSKAKLIRYGLDPMNDYYASDIHIDASGMSFKINYGSESLNVKTKILGRHNILNILVAFAVARELDVDVKDLGYQISMLEATRHRLSIEQISNYLIIDDSFNSNNVGFINALEVLGYYSSPKVLITPGIVEGGSLEEMMNYELASEIIKVVDEVVLIDTKSSSYIMKGLHDLGFENIKISESFKDAKKYVFDKYQKASILIENDVSDIYKI